MFKFYVLFIPLLRTYGAVLYTNRGHNVTLPCSYASSAAHLSWYKQVAGEPPQIISYFYTPSSSSIIFYNHFKNSRFSVHTGAGFYHLKISNVQDSDSAMYYCGQTSVTVTTFDNGIFLICKESSRRSFLQQPASNSVKPGGSVTLNCTVHTASDGDHHVYWFKKESANSHLGIMYIHTHSSNQCVKSPEPSSPGQSCVYTLSKKSVSLSDDGTYYCALASCGEILFGRGTRVHVEEEPDGFFLALMICMVAALIVSVILNVILISILCNMTRRKDLYPGGLHPQSSVTENTTDRQNEESEALQYVALDFKKKQGKRQRQKSTEEETIYSAVTLSE